MKVATPFASPATALVLATLLLTALLGRTAQADEILITGLKPNEHILELFNPSTGAFEREIAVERLTFPIAVKEDLGGMFLIELDGQRYTVGSTFVFSTKEYRIAAHCDNRVHIQDLGASTRGIGGKGCE